MTLQHSRRPPSPVTNRPYRIRALGQVEQSPRHSTRGTHNDDAMLMLFTSGKGRYHLGSRIIDVHGGMLGLVLPEQAPGVLICDKETPYCHIYCRFAGTEAMMAARRILHQRNGASFTDCPMWRMLHQTLQTMLTYHREGKDYTKNPNEPIRPEEGLLAHLLALLEYGELTKQSGITERALRRYIVDHMAEPINLDRVAKHFGISKPYLCRVARRELGDTLQHSMELAKMEWAKELLSDKSLSPLSIQEIAQHVGYNDALYFSKVFKRYYEMSPRTWRFAQLA